MTKLKNTKKCEFCEKEFEWCCIRLEKDEVVVSRIEHLTKNVKNLNETDTKYIVKLQCPNCLKKQFEEIDK